MDLLSIVRYIVLFLSLFSFMMGILYLGRSDKFRTLKADKKLLIDSTDEQLNTSEIVGGSFGVGIGALLFVSTFFIYSGGVKGAYDI